MNVNIKVISVENTFVPTAKGGYNKLEVNYKNLTTNKVEGKTIMSFGLTADAYKALADAKSNDLFTIESEKKPGKDGQEYWTWMSAKQSAPGAMAETVANNNKTTGFPVKNTYETPEERAKKQVYIVKQSSLSAAIALLSVGAKAPPKPEEVLAQAQQFTDWVFQEQKVNPQSLVDMPDDFPDVQ
jgi:hypothetical protein